MCYTYNVKVVVLGDSGVGKTSLLERFCHNKFLHASFRPTIGVKPFEKILHSHNKDYKLYMWDTAGQERYRSITSHFIVRATGCLIVFDVSRPASLCSALDYWYDSVKTWEPDLPIVLVCNKVDIEHPEWVKQKASKFSKNHSITMYETSALTGQGVFNAFLDAANVSGKYRYISKDEDLFMNSLRLDGSLDHKGDEALYPELRNKCVCR